jgi:hypothetical protein
MARRKTVTRRPTYGDAVRWLAFNDETIEHDCESIAGFTTTLLAADLFGAEPMILATDIVRTRHGAGRWSTPEEAVCRCFEEGKGK